MASPLDTNLYVRSRLRRPRGCTTSDIQRETKIECPSGRIAEMMKAGVPIVSVGRKKYPGGRAFEMYAIEGAYKTVYRFDEASGVMVEERVVL
ncbi:hypothetical protein [Bradyrhizobium sp. LVM 105]|uniref:hypothetical protein n=1 Tax=Bradyrhizobium sp. LVM 105 TaxID=2341115 RepID=UPI000F80D916|nr:hypothetical protein [Bradyrhizobium sp. LVM 105]